MVPLVDGLVKGCGARRFLDSLRSLEMTRILVISTKAVRPRGEISEQLLHQPQHPFFHHFLIQVRDDREGHALRDEKGPGKAAKVLRFDAPDGGGSAQDGQAQRMPLEEHAFELVIDILGRIVLVGNDLI